jgi:hypothetical protein
MRVTVWVTARPTLVGHPARSATVHAVRCLRRATPVADVAATDLGSVATPGGGAGVYAVLASPGSHPGVSPTACVGSSTERTAKQRSEAWLRERTILEVNDMRPQVRGQRQVTWASADQAPAKPSQRDPHLGRPRPMPPICPDVARGPHGGWSDERVASRSRRRRCSLGPRGPGSRPRLRHRRTAPTRAGSPRDESAAPSDQVAAGRHCHGNGYRDRPEPSARLN